LLNGLLAEFVTPVLAERGFLRSRRRYWFVGSTGNVVVIEFRPFDTRYQGGFILNWGIVPALAWEFFTEGKSRRLTPQYTWGTLQKTVFPVKGFWISPRVGSWEYPYDGGGPAKCMSALVELLETDLLPMWTSLLDTDALERETYARHLDALYLNNAGSWWPGTALGQLAGQRSWGRDCVDTYGDVSCG